MARKKISGVSSIIGQNLKEIRGVFCLSQSDISMFLGVSFQQVQKYETGANRIPVEHLFTLQQILRVPYDRFFQGIEFEDDADADTYVQGRIEEIREKSDDLQTQKIICSLKTLSDQRVKTAFLSLFDLLCAEA